MQSHTLNAPFPACIRRLFFTLLLSGAVTSVVAQELQPVSAESPTQGLPNVTVLGTGGTIAGTGANRTAMVGYKAATVAIDTLIASIPELNKVANIKTEQIFQVASESMTVDQWLKLAKRVNVLLAQPDVDGIVITYGTDTIEETAYFLDLTVKSHKPVVMVGAMRPSNALSADGPLNLYNAVLLAGSKEAIGKGVLVALNDQINAARDVTKTNTSTTDAFKSTELGVLGYVQGRKVYFYRQSTRKNTLDTEFDISNLAVLPRVDIVYGYADMDSAALDGQVAAGAKGIIHAGVGNGSVAAQMKVPLLAARKKGVIIVRASRVGQGIVARNGEASDDALDFVVADTLNAQKARVLLMLGLTRTTSPQEIQRMFYTY